MKRVLVVAAASAALVLGGAVAAMAGAPSMSVSSPTNGATVTTDTPTITGTVRATSPSGQITGDLQLTISSSAGHPGWSDTLPAWCGQSSCTFSVPVSPAIPYNGAYTLSVQAAETDSSGSGNSGAAPQPVTVVSSFSMAAPAAAPSGLTSSLSPDGSFVKLGWNSESYPDLVGYQVTRSPSGPGFPASTSSNRFEDTGVSPGTTYTYSVVAIRQGATSGSTVSSAPASTTVGNGASPDSGPGGAGTAGSGPGTAASNGTTGNAAGLGHYGSAGATSSSNTSSVAGLLHPSSGSGGSGVSAQAAPAAPAPPSGPADGVAPGSDNPAVAPFSTGTGGFSSAAGPGVTITYTTSHAAVVRDYAAVALAALLLAIAAHLLWVRRQLRLA